VFHPIWRLAKRMEFGGLNGHISLRACESGIDEHRYPNSKSAIGKRRPLTQSSLPPVGDVGREPE
jgi:hypothetical protein